MSRICGAAGKDYGVSANFLSPRVTRCRVAPVALVKNCTPNSAAGFTGHLKSIA